jgi:putative ABC transport system permease protein
VNAIANRRLRALALRAVPRDWRASVERDLDDERRGPVWFAAAAAVIGVRLRLSRVAWPHIPPLLRHLADDARHGVRAAARRPAQSLAVVTTLAVGIGANTAIYSVFNWILLRPMPGVTRPGDLVTVKYQPQARRDVSFWVSYRDYADIRDGVPAFENAAASAWLKMDVIAGGYADRVEGEVVTTSYFSLFGVTPAVGRDFTASEEQGVDRPPAIISRRLWRRAFDGRQDVLGQPLTIDGRAFVVVGVAPASFQGRSLITATDLWLPIGAYPVLQPQSARGLMTSRGQTLFADAFARLRPGATLAQAQQQALAAAANVPDFANRRPAAGQIRVVPTLTQGVGREVFATDRLGTIFKLLMGAVGLLLLLACANAANLLLARTTGRRREIAVCQAIGASRARIIRQQLAEGMVLSIAAAGAGLALAWGLTTLFDGTRILTSLPAVTGVEIDWRVGAFTLTAALVTGVLFAVAPAVAGSRVNLQSSLKDGLTSTRHGRRLLRSTLVLIQVTVSVLLLVGAGLFVRTLNNIRALDLGFDPAGVISVSVEPSRYGYNQARSIGYVVGLLDRVRQTPGIESAAFTQTTSVSSGRNEVAFVRPEAPKGRIAAALTHVSRDFFSTLRVPILAGRDFTDAEISPLDSRNQRQGVIIISRTLAEQLFPAGGAIGSRLTLRYPEGKIVEVVGVVGDVRGRPLTAEPEPWAYMPTGQPSWGQIVARSSLPAAPTIAALREAAKAVDPVVLPGDLEPFSAAIDRALAEQRLFARLTGVFAIVAALLAGIGIYGMMSGAVAERRKEFGIRLALGARASSVLALVLRTALPLAATGIAAGLGGAALLRRLIESRLYGVTPLDPATLVAAAAGTVVLGAAASLIPALRAARVDPVTSLRVE